MENTGIIIVLLIVVILVASVLYERKRSDKRNRILQELASLLYQEKYSEYENLLKNNSTLFPPFNYTYLLFNEAISKGDTETVKEKLEMFKNNNMNTSQKEAVYPQAFNYFMNIDEYKKAEEYLNLIKELDNEDLIKRCEIMYDTFALNGFKYLDELENNFDNLNDREKLSSAYMLSRMYLNKGDKEKAEEYEKISQNLL